MARIVKLYDHLSNTYVQIDWRYILWCRLLPNYTLVCMTDYKQYKFDKNELAKALAK